MSLIAISKHLFGKKTLSWGYGQQGSRVRGLGGSTGQDAVQVLSGSGAGGQSLDGDGHWAASDARQALTQHDCHYNVNNFFLLEKKTTKKYRTRKYAVFICQLRFCGVGDFYINNGMARGGRHGDWEADC